MKLNKIFIPLLVSLFFVSFLGAQLDRQTGVIRGVVVDAEGIGMPGVSVAATSPALMGTVTSISGENGAYRLSGLPPGLYTVVSELAGFRTVRREGIRVQVGTNISLEIQMEQSAISQEVTVMASAPVVDVKSNKFSTIMSKELIQKLPLNRDLTSIIGESAGFAGNLERYTGSIHGGMPGQISYELDGVNVNEPIHNYLMFSVQFDAMEEVEVASAGLPAQIGNTGGGFVNVVTKSGGNEFHGQVQAFYTKDTLAQVLFPDEMLKAMGMGKPTSPIYFLDASAVLGGPIIKDKLWFFGDLGYNGSKYQSVFIPTTILGKNYAQYVDTQTTYHGFLKLTSQLSKSMRFFVMASGNLLNRPYYNGGGARLAEDATFQLKNNTKTAYTANLSWQFGSDTFVDFRAGLVDRDYLITQREEFANNPSFRDRYTGYSWNGINTWNSYMYRQSRQASVRMSHFMDGFLGGDHEIGLGLEYQRGLDDYTMNRPNPLNVDYYNGSPYYYRGLYGLTGPHPTFGDGRVSFPIAGPVKGDTFVKASGDRLSAYLQDSFTIKNRLTINFGLRLDHYNGSMPPTTKGKTGGFAYEVGQEALLPVFGFNPYDSMTTEAWNNAMGWTALSPRVGFTYDLFGNNKTALKVAYSRYTEALPLEAFTFVHPFAYRSFTFNWLDSNGNGIADAPPFDHYSYLSGEVKDMDPAYYRQRLPSDIVAPSYNEIVVALNHELFKDFSINLQYIYKNKKNELDFVYYDTNTNRYWYTYELAPDWWIPFETTVPAVGEYPAQQVTAYFMSKNAPWDRIFTQHRNIPEIKRKYQGFEIVLNKRYSNGWAFGGSVLLSKYLSTNGNVEQQIWNANNWVNSYGRDFEDVPLAIKLFGTADLPFGFISSFYYTHRQGTPYNRNVTIVPPAGWAKANNTLEWSYAVRVEPNGSRRIQSYDNVDLRLEKEFPLSRFGKLGIFLDVYNLLGNRYIYTGVDPGGNWLPTDANTTAGKYTVGSTYGKASGIDGTRVFKFSLRLNF